jgi:ABC-type nitrate/sulfonate/bicarbonate transport system permease component
MQRILKGAIVPVVFLLVWEACARSGLLAYESLSFPSAILRAGVGAVLDGSMLVATWQTFEGALVGLAIGAAAGVLLGALLGLSARLAATTGPTFDALRAIPAVALMPLALLMFGWGVSMEASVVAYACIWPVLIATWAAVRGVEPRLLEVADALEMSFAERLRKIVIPAAFARINVGLRIALGVALVVAVTVEIAVNPRGLGYNLVLAQQSFKPDLMYAHILWLALMGFALNAALRTLDTPERIG